MADDVYVLPMSPAQQRLWFLDHMDPGTTMFNIPAAFRFHGPLDVDRVQRVLSQIVLRHEVLRTSLTSVDGEAVQIIHPAGSIDLPLTDLSALAPAMREAALTRELRAAAARPFDLAKGPLFRPALWRLSADDHALMLCMHHAISDGWSLGVLAHDFTAMWIADVDGRPCPLAPLAIQYADYSHWQRERMQSGVLEPQRLYWLEQLRGHRGVLRLPTDHARPTRQTFNAGACEFRLPARVVDGLRAFGKEAGVTLFMTCISAYALLLSRYSGQDDLFVGIPAAGRTQAELEPLVGFFVNALIIRFTIDHAASARDLVTNARRTVLDALSNQDVSLDSLMDALEIERHPAFEPLVQATFALQNLSGGGGSLPNLDIEPMYAECMHSRYDLMLVMSETPDGISGNMVYNTDLFEHGTIIRMMQHLERVLEAIAATPDVPLASLSWVTEGELYEHLGLQPDAVERILPLVPMQRDLYLDSLAHPESAQNCVGLTFLVKAGIDPGIWHEAAQALTDTQPVMRTRIRTSSAPFAETAYQCVLRTDRAEVEVLDLSGSALGDREIDARLARVIQRPYDPHGPLVRHFLVKLATDAWIAGLANHHMLLDGIATVQAATWLASEYTRRTGTPLTPDPLPPSLFHDAIPAIRAHTDTRRVLSRWQNLLASVTPLQCPAAASNAAPDAARLVTKDLVIPPDLWTTARQFCRQHHITPQILLKCVFAMIADAHFQSDGDLLIQEFHSGRGAGQHVGLGCYYAALPFVIPRRNLSGEATCGELFEYARTWQRASSDRAGLSVLEQRRLAPPGSVSLLFNFITAKLTLHVGADAAAIRRFTPYADGFVQFEVSAIGDQVHLNLTYDRAIFAEEAFLDRTIAVMRQVLAGTERLSGLSLLLPREARVDVDTPAFEYTSIPERIARQAHLTPDAPAILQGDMVLTYRELMADGDRIARVLDAEGIGPGDLVGICLRRSPLMIVAIVAVLRSGAAYVPMDAAYPDGRLRHMATDAQCRVVLTESGLVARFGGLDCRLLTLDVATFAGVPVDNELPMPSRRPESTFYVLYTSGSTGVPKGAAVTDLGASNLVDWYVRAFTIGPTDRFLIVSAFGFDLTQKNFFAALTSGAALVLPEGEHFEPDRILDGLARHRATIVNCAPSAFYSLVDDAARLPQLATLRHVFLGGESIHVTRLEAWLRSGHYHAEIVNTYGPTECTDVVCSYRLTDPFAFLHRQVPLGTPVDGVQLHVIDGMDRLLPPYGVGELCISGRSVGTGYWRNPSLTAKTFVPNRFGPGLMYRTGDLAYRLPDGVPVFVGRRDAQVKVRGLRIELGEIESALRDATGLAEWLVLASNDALTAYVKTDRAGPPVLSVSTVRQQLASRLPDYMLPQDVIRVSAWPLSPNGKVDRDALARLTPERTPRQSSPLEGETEIRLAQLWDEVLDRPTRDRDESFFTIGGHSLLAARVVSRIRSEFGIDLPLRMFFDTPTIAAIAQRIDTLTSEALLTLSEHDLDRLLGDT